MTSYDQRGFRNRMGACFYVLMIGIGMIVYGIIKLIKIHTFKKKQLMNYYRIIPATFLKYEYRAYMFRAGYKRGNDYYPVYSYLVGEEEHILKGKYYVKPSTFTEGQSINLYQDPVTGSIFENPSNGFAHAMRFLIVGIIAAVIAIIIICLFAYKLHNFI